MAQKEKGKTQKDEPDDVELVVNNDIDVSLTSPADYSFRKLRFLDELEGARPRSLRLGKPIVRGPSGKLVSNSLWLNNNNLESMQFLTVFVNTLFEAPNKIQWIDFSFNNISEIDKVYIVSYQLTVDETSNYIFVSGRVTLPTPKAVKLQELLKFVELKILYLHGNCISSLENVAKLRGLKKLRTLTMHGCPVELLPFYRQHVISMLPQLKSLDFGTVTPKESNAPPPPGMPTLFGAE